MPLPIGHVDAQLETDVLLLMQLCQQPSMAPVQTGSATPLAQSGSHEQPAWQPADVSQEHPPPQSGSQPQLAWHVSEVSHEQPPICSQR